MTDTQYCHHCGDYIGGCPIPIKIGLNMVIWLCARCAERDMRIGAEQNMDQGW